ncbi:MAG: hypothetical protein IKQ39_00815 [Oscillospiraceae bacterium]|nr:hypothetical protein [Oscillospiraceae bacterium]
MAENANVQAADSKAEDTEIIMEEQKNNQPKHNRKKWVLLAAAVLAAGGAAAGGILFAKHRRQNTDVKPQGVFNLRLTDETDNYGRHVLQQSESGWYYVKDYFDYGRANMTEDGHEALCQTRRMLLTYSDAETGESSVLCAHPNCTHDGSLFCPASTKAYSDAANRSSNIGGFQIYADGYLYVLAEKPENPDEDIMAEVFGHPEKYGTDIEMSNGYVLTDQGAFIDKRDQVLLRYEPDGTGIEEIHNFGGGTGSCMPVYHRGYLWFSVQLISYGEMTENPITHRKSLFVNGGYEIWGYELKTGELVKVYSGMGSPTVNHVDGRPWGLFGAGDYLYISASEDDWVSGGGCRKLNLLTGELTAAPEYSSNNGFNQKYALRQINPAYERSVDVEESGWYRVDLLTDEKKLLPAFSFFRSLPVLCGDYIISQELPETDAYQYDDYDWTKLDGENRLETPKIIICDLDGNQLAEVKPPKLTEFPENRGIIQSVSIACTTEDMLYLEVMSYDESPYWILEDYIVSCPIKDIIDGKCEWKTRFALADTADAAENYEIRLAEEQDYLKKHPKNNEENTE